MTFTANECNDIMKPLIPLVYRYAPKSCLGLGLLDMYTMQGIAQIKVLLDHIGKDSMVGKFLYIELETACLELGTGIHLFELD